MTIADIRDLSDALFWMSLGSGFVGGFLAMFVVGFIFEFTRSFREAE